MVVDPLADDRRDGDGSLGFDGAGFDSSDRDGPSNSNQYLPVAGLPLYSLTMPDGIATFTDSQGRSFLLAVGEGDSREYEPDRGNIFFDLTRANVMADVEARLKADFDRRSAEFWAGYQHRLNESKNQ